MSQIFNENDIVKFKNQYSGTTFKAKILKRFTESTYEIEVLECSTKRFIGNVTEIDFAAEHNGARIKILEVKRFEDKLSADYAAFYLGLCHLAVDTNDKEWYKQSYRQYLLWKGKAKYEKSN